jgi:hypothetical protein
MEVDHLENLGATFSLRCFYSVQSVLGAHGKYVDITSRLTLVQQTCRTHRPLC